MPENAATAMIRALDADGDGVVRYHELVDFFVDVLLHAERGAFSFTLVPIRRRWRGERRSLRTFSPGASLRPGSLGFNPDAP